MIFRSLGTQLEMNTLDFLAVPGLAYLAAGVLYGTFETRYVDLSAQISLLTVFVCWITLRRFAFARMEVDIRPRLERALILLCWLLIASIGAFYISVGPSYFAMDKWARYDLIQSVAFLRIGFWSAMVLIFGLLIEKRGRARKSKRNLIITSIVFIFIEGSRELLIVSAIHVIIYQWKFCGRMLVPQGFIGVLAVAFSLYFVTALFKPLFYIVFLGKSYDGGWLSYGELVNWYRWLQYARQNWIDIESVQRFDIWYFLNALVMPFSRVPSSSAVWMSEVLGELGGAGKNYGYSGVLWLSYYFPGGWIFVPWLLASLFFTWISRLRSFVGIMFMASVCFLSYRLFRSEWVLVAKSSLWLFFYPSVIVYLVAIVLSGKEKEDKRMTGVATMPGISGRQFLLRQR